MEFIYAYRRSAFYPQKGEGLKLPSGDVRKKYLAAVRAIGFEGIELGLDVPGRATATAEDIARLRTDLEEAELPCVALRGGGSLVDSRVDTASGEELRRAVDVAGQLGARLVNVVLIAPPTDPSGPGTGYGERVSQGSSRQARGEDYERTARAIGPVADLAAEIDVRLSIELHQRTIVDNSRSMLRLLDLIDRPNVGANADAANTYWAYEEPEESFEDAIVALAPRANYWHCKNLTRAHIPELQRAIYTRVPIPDGDLDYRFAMAAMLDAGYDGPIAVEGLRVGDQLAKDARSLRELRSLYEQLSASRARPRLTGSGGQDGTCTRHHASRAS